MNYLTNKRIAMIVLPFLLQACGGSSSSNSLAVTVPTSNITPSPDITKPTVFSDSVPLALEKNSGLQAIASKGNMGGVGAPRKVLRRVIEGITYVTWQPVANADFYSVYVGHGNNVSAFQLLATLEVNETLQYPISTGLNAYVTTTAFGIESGTSLLTRSTLARSSRIEHEVYDN